MSALATGFLGFLNAPFSNTKSGKGEDRASSDKIEDQTEEKAAIISQPAAVVDFDFDGDGKADIGRWRPNSTQFDIEKSSGGGNLSYILGSSTSKFAPADFDNDGKVDAAVFDNGAWKYKVEPNNPSATEYTISLGQSGDIPVPANFGGDARADAAVFRPSTGAWYIQITGGSPYSTNFGTSGDIPVVGDYDGDGLADQAVFRPSTGEWHVNGSQAGYYGLNWGVSTDVPVPADYDADGKTDIAVYRGSTGTWYILTSGTGPDITEVWGNYGDQPVTADYDNDGKADLAVWRPTTGVWYIKKSTGGQEYYTLGVPGERAVPSAYVKQIGGELAPYELAKARLEPRNATGGTNLYSQNFGWGTSLMGLPGRAGMNAGFGMSYNSLVWTKEGSEVHFDTNQDNISPGFRFGFPTIEAPYYIPGGGSTDPYFAYIMVSPSGERTEFRQIAASEYFETTDSSYLQLKTKGTPDPNTPVEEIELTVRGTDGTVMSYVWIAGAFRCTQIKDRNGNYITIEHDELGLLREVTDTLGREIVVNYSEDLYPTTIQQTWKDNNGQGSNTTTHTWATFSYSMETVATSFADSLSVVGPPNGTVIKVLDKVTYPDNSYTKFHHNGYIQVYKIENFAANNFLLNHVRTNIESPATNQTNVPRFSETRSWVQNFNGGNETVISNSFTPGQTPTDIDGNTVSATLIQTALQNHPNGNVTNTYVGSSGWMEGLPIRTDDYANGNGIELMRSSWTKWTQDDINSADIQNPRVTETKIGDGVNLKRSTIDYLLYPTTNVSQFGLVSAVNVYDTNQSTVLKRAETDYNLAAAYLDRRIIGVPSETRVFGYENGQLALVSKMTYGFDEGDFTQQPNQIIAPIRHDTANYGSSFIIGRGNMTSTTRHDVTGQTPAVTSRVVYDIAGSPVAQFDPLNRRVAIDYTDVFNDSENRNSFAYPTKVYDPAGNYSEVKYRHDIGANVWAKSPAPNGQSQGKITERDYDSIGRLLKDKIVNHGGAYTRYEYPNNGIQSKVFSTIVDTNNNSVGDTADEVLSESWSDGAGRVRRSRTEHPGSIGGWSGSIVEYDIVGRAKRQSVPTEISVPNENDPDSWTPAGDDSARSWLWTHQKYDWMGRVIRRINTDGLDQTALNDSDVLFSYDGCGCAGGLVVTVEGELVPRDDQPTLNGRRKQKVYSDILGRTSKTETYEWDGATVYSTTVSTFNGRDQVTLSRQYAGAVGSQTFQDTTATFDGHGRLKTSHRPEQQNANQTPAFTSYNYNADDSISNVTDARGASTNYLYNDPRGLLTQISYSIPANSDIVVPPTVNFDYDALGNRIWMADALGRVDYEYDGLSRIVAETRQFNDSLPNAPLSGNRYKLQYSYELSGDVKSVIDPFGVSVNYGFDKTGVVNDVSGSSFGGFASYASNIKYRAWGATKSEDYTNGSKTKVDYDSRLQPASYRVNGQSAGQEVLKHARNYRYNADGQLRFVGAGSSDDITNADRLYKYDHAGRITGARTSIEAHGQTESNLDNLMYRLDYSFDAYGNLARDSGTVWTKDVSSENKTFVNNRVVNSPNPASWTYDEDGRPTMRNIYDAAGLVVYNDGGNFQNFEYATERETFVVYDGDGQRGKTTTLTETFFNDSESTRQIVSEDLFLITSTVLGGATISEVKRYAEATGRHGSPPGDLVYHRRPSRERTFLYLNGKVLGWQRVECSAGDTSCSSESQEIVWEHRDPGGTSFSVENRLGFAYDGSFYIEPVEFDPFGRNAAIRPQPPESEPDTGSYSYAWFQSALDGECHYLGLATSCSLVRASLQSDGAVQCPNNNCGPIRNGNEYKFFNAYGDGYQDYSPMGSIYVGGGHFQTRDQRKQTVRGKKSGTGRGPKPKLIKRSKAEVAKSKAASVTPSPDEERPYSANDVTWNPRLIVHLKTEQQLANRIKDLIYEFAANVDCEKAFEAAKAVPIRVQIPNLTVVTESIFNDPNEDHAWAPDDGGHFATQLRGVLAENTNFFFGVTVGDITPDKLQQGRRFVGLTNVGIAASNMDEIVLHALVHSGGIPGIQQGFATGILFGTAYRKDLNHLGAKYDNILSSCLKKKE